VPELLELADEPFRALFERAALVEVVGSEFLVGDLALEDVVGGDEDRVAQCAGCLAGAAEVPALEALRTTAERERAAFAALPDAGLTNTAGMSGLSQFPQKATLGPSLGAGSALREFRCKWSSPRRRLRLPVDRPY
jgi:hypothetical protein